MGSVTSGNSVPDPFGAAGELSAEDVAESLWLARTQMAGNPDGVGVRSSRPRRHAPAATPITEHGPSRAFWPAKNWVASHSAHDLDDEATAAFAVLDHRWLPVVRPAGGPRWDLVLVVDDSISMQFWRRATSNFARALSRQGTFRKVRIRLLDIDPTGGLTLRHARSSTQRHQITELIDSTGRQIILVLTDGANEVWRSGRALSAMRRWGGTHPVALVHLLPWHTWNRMGLEVHRLRLRSPRPGAPNSRWEWRPQSAAPGVFDDLADAMPISVVEPSSTGLARWARMAVGTPGWVDIGAVLVPPDPVTMDRTELWSRTPSELVHSFRAAASPVAFTLATYLAAAPLEHVVISRVRERIARKSTIGHLSEILGSPLVVSVNRGHGRHVHVDFVPGVRAELLAYGRTASTELVRNIVQERLRELDPSARAADRDGDLILALAKREPSEQVTRYLTAEISALEAISGERLDEARTLRVILRHPPNVHVGSTPIESLTNDTTTSPHAGMRTVVVQNEAGGTDVTTTVDRHLAGHAPSEVQRVFGGVPPRNPVFTGREDLLRELDERLKPGATAAVLPETIHGLGGVGKSLLAIEYAYRFRTKFELIWWIPAERPVQIVNSLVELGKRLDLRVGTEANVAVQPVLDALKGGGQRKIPPNWLLIFDNADDPRDVQPYLPTGGPGRILITSRNSQWLTIARPLEVNVFKRAESVQLLRRRGPELTNDEADRLAEALGDLPLAIAQAAAWRAETGMPASEYLELLADKELELLDVATTVDYPTSVAAAWNLSLERLRERNLSALRLLQTCAFFAPEPVLRSMFSNGRGIETDPDLQKVLRNKLRLGEATRDINRFALARIDYGSNSLQMHRLVQAVLIAQMTDQERESLRHVAHLILAANDPDAPDDADSWPKYTELNVHLVASNAIECESQEVRDLLYNQARFLYEWGDHERSAKHSRRMYDIWRDRLGPDHQETLKIGLWLGFMLWVLGHYDEAAELNAGILEAYQRTVGEVHEDTIEALGAVAADNRAKGEFATALELSRQNYENCVRLFGADDPVTLNAAHNLGVSLRLAGDFRAARDLDEITWDRKIQIFGKDHSLTLLTEVGLTIDIRECGDYRGAHAKHEEIVATYRRLQELQDPLNPLLLRALRHLAAMRRKAGDHHGALAAADEALNGLKSRYGPDHVETLAAVLSKSIDLRHLGTIGSATSLALDTWERYRRSLGDEHPHTLSAAVNVAILRRLTGDPQGARELDDATLSAFRRRLGDEHPSTIVTAVNLASDMAALGDVNAARELDEKTLRHATGALGADHPTSLACKANLAHDVLAAGNQEEGVRLRSEAIAAFREKLGPDHPAVSQLENDRRADCDIDPMPL